MLATVTPCAPLWLDDDFLLANHRGANVVMAASRHTKIQLRFFGVPNDGFFKFYLRSSASSFGRISDKMAWKETSGFSLLGAWFETCTMGICLWVSAWLVRDLKPVRWEFVSENQLGAGAIRNRAFHPRFTIGTQRWTSNTNPSFFSVFLIFLKALYYM